MEKNYDAFLSYSHKDRDFAKELAQRLVKAGFSVFYDDSELAIGDSFAKSLADALRKARATLVIMSPDYFASDWSRSELEISTALELEDTEREGGRIIPLLLRDCDIPPLLQVRTYADCRTDAAFEKAFPLIVDSLKAQASSNLRGDGAIAQGSGAVAAGSGGVAVGGDSTGIINIGHIVSQESTVALRSQLEELRKKVDAFTGDSPASSSLSNNQEFRLDPNLCFVAMPFGSSDLNDIYEYFVKPSIEASCSLRCERGDDVFGSNIIMEDIRQSICSARVVIADLTGRNPNVFYEVGIAHTLNKDVLLLSQSMDDVPFDLRHRRVLVYENTPKGCKLLENRVVENLNAILNNDA